MTRYGYDEPRGILIGSDFRARYKFFTRNGRQFHYRDEYFDSDAEAEAWVREHYPDHYAAGVGMRVWD
jgi:hypothetical protein